MLRRVGAATAGALTAHAGYRFAVSSGPIGTQHHLLQSIVTFELMRVASAVVGGRMIDWLEKFSAVQAQRFAVPPLDATRRPLLGSIFSPFDTGRRPSLASRRGHRHRGRFPRSAPHPQHLRHTNHMWIASPPANVLSSTTSKRPCFSRTSGTSGSRNLVPGHADHVQDLLPSRHSRGF